MGNVSMKSRFILPGKKKVSPKKAPSVLSYHLSQLFSSIQFHETPTPSGHANQSADQLPHGAGGDEEGHGRRARAEGRAAGRAARAAHDRVRTLGRALHRPGAQLAVQRLHAVAARVRRRPRAPEARDPRPAVRVLTCAREIGRLGIVAFFFYWWWDSLMVYWHVCIQLAPNGYILVRLVWVEFWVFVVHSDLNYWGTCIFIITFIGKSCWLVDFSNETK